MSDPLRSEEVDTPAGTFEIVETAAARRRPVKSSGRGRDARIRRARSLGRDAPGRRADRGPVVDDTSWHVDRCSERTILSIHEGRRVDRRLAATAPSGRRCSSVSHRALTFSASSTTPRPRPAPVPERQRSTQAADGGADLRESRIEQVIADGDQSRRWLPMAASSSCSTYRTRRVFIHMGGGCQGCAMSTATLKNGVETALRGARSPRSPRVLDTTDHAAGSNPYFPAIGRSSGTAALSAVGRPVG